MNAIITWMCIMATCLGIYLFLVGLEYLLDHAADFIRSKRIMARIRSLPLRYARIITCTLKRQMDEVPHYFHMPYFSDKLPQKPPFLKRPGSGELYLIIGTHHTQQPSDSAESD